MPRKHRRLV